MTLLTQEHLPLPATEEEEQPLVRLRSDIRSAARMLKRDELRFLVNAYYIWQDQRIRAKNQIRALGAHKEGHLVHDWLFENARRLEANIKSVLAEFVKSDPTASWALSVVGIGPVISAGLSAHIDLSRGQTSVGKIWRFAGLDPTAAWSKGEKRPWNADLKRLCWLTGESFVKVQSRPGDVYGKMYVARKALEAERNENKQFANQATAILASKNIGKDTDAYKAYSQGKLPPAHIHARAKRYAVKIFLAHYFEVAYWYHHNERAPKPYVMEHMGHTDYMAPPNAPWL